MVKHDAQSGTGTMSTRPESKMWAVGALGQKLTLDDLPASGATRWYPRLKAEVVAAVDGGLLTDEEACRRYGLTFEEFTGWKLGLGRAGLKALRATCVQQYRAKYRRDQQYGG